MTPSYSPSKPITKEEALQYDPTALQADTEKREKNIKIFETTIETEKNGIKENMHMMSVIDHSHPDYKTLEENIKKKEANIKMFDEAIFEERRQIDRDLQMIALIKAN